MEHIPKHAKLFSSSTRSHIFEIISKSKEPIEVAELARVLSLNHNAIRQHLNKLKDSGVVLEKKVSTFKKGRPKLVYVLSSEGQSMFGKQEAYTNLSIGLLNAIRFKSLPIDAGKDVGVSIAKKKIEEKSYPLDPVDYISQEMARQGFSPSRDKDTQVGVIELGNCPLKLAAATDSQTVCQFHLGLVQGLAMTIGGIKVNYLEPKNPYKAGCILKVEYLSISK